MKSYSLKLTPEERILSDNKKILNELIDGKLEEQYPSLTKLLTRKRSIIRTVSRSVYELCFRNLTYQPDVTRKEEGVLNFPISGKYLTDFINETAYRKKQAKPVVQMLNFLCAMGIIEKMENTPCNTSSKRNYRTVLLAQEGKTIENKFALPRLTKKRLKEIEQNCSLLLSLKITPTTLTRKSLADNVKRNNLPAAFLYRTYPNPENSKDDPERLEANVELTDEILEYMNELPFTPTRNTILKEFTDRGYTKRELTYLLTRSSKAVIQSEYLYTRPTNAEILQFHDCNGMDPGGFIYRKQLTPIKNEVKQTLSLTDFYRIATNYKTAPGLYTFQTKSKAKKQNHPQKVEITDDELKTVIQIYKPMNPDLDQSSLEFHKNWIRSEAYQNYFISERGTVFNLYNNEIKIVYGSKMRNRNGTPNQKDYWITGAKIFSFSGKNMLLHRLMAICFPIQVQPGLFDDFPEFETAKDVYRYLCKGNQFQVHHADRNGLNNHYKNLWFLSKEAHEEISALERDRDSIAKIQTLVDDTLLSKTEYQHKLESIKKQHYYETMKSNPMGNKIISILRTYGMFGFWLMIAD